jgi:acetone carboxylase gamma subunit
MENTNNTLLGEEVLCIKNEKISDEIVAVKDKIYTVYDLKFCFDCGMPHLSIFQTVTSSQKQTCSCGKTFNNYGKHWFNGCNFILVSEEQLKLCVEKELYEEAALLKKALDAKSLYKSISNESLLK